ncbi:hypothetical protein Scep_019362 [Stephania cephalantha]|uniref:Uncharacterized protein n=1 Tax=Stephania cephalantha TaxID=152367 RepID=A0AAP0IB25_9MAGN
MALHRLLYLLHLPLHCPHHLAGPTRPWEPPLELLEGAMELPHSLLNSPLPPAPSAAPQKGQGGTPHIVRLPIIIESIGYDVLMNELRALGVRPDFVTDEACNRYRKYWARTNFKAWSEKASHNRITEKGGPGTGPSKHTGGTRSFRTYEDILALDKDEEDEVTPNDVFLNVHTKDHDGMTFIDNRSAYTINDFGAKLEEEEISTSHEPMVRRSEFDAVVQRLVQFKAFVQSQLRMCMDFGANTSQAPPPLLPQEHHQQVGMDPTCSPQQQQHDDDDRDNPDWVDEEHLSDES